MVTFPDAAAKVTSPAPFCTIITLNPAGNVSSGTVKEKLDELLQIKTFPLCDAARVVAPVIVTVEALKLEIGFPPKVVSPVPFGATAISPLAPSVILMEPVVELPVLIVISLSPLDLMV